MRVINAVNNNKRRRIEFYIQKNGRKGHRTVKWRFNPYFFTPFELSEQFKVNTYSGTKTIEVHSRRVKAANGIFYKNEVNSSSDVSSIRFGGGVELKDNCFEADIPYFFRHIIDTGMHLGDEPLTILFFDIETVTPKNRMPSYEKDRIVCISCIDEKGDGKWFYDENEKQMLYDFLKYASKYSLLAGWNIFRFDIPYLEYRCALHGLPFCSGSKIPESRVVENLVRQFQGYQYQQQAYQFGKRWQWADMYKMYRATRLYPVASYRLDAVAQHETGMRKLSKEALVAGNVQQLKAYSMRDVEMLKAIEEATKIIQLYDNFAKLGDTFITQAHAFSRVIDTIVLRDSYNDDISKRFVHRSKKILTEQQYLRNKCKYKGAFVANLSDGLHENVIALDFSSLYPSVLQTFNISFDTKDENGEITAPGNNVRLKKQRGIYSKMLDRFFELRNYYKKQMNKYRTGSKQYNIYRCLEQSTKFLTNSSYGSYGFEGSRFYDKQLVEAVTLTGQWLIKNTRKYLQQIGYRVLYLDTDSCYVASKHHQLSHIVQEANDLVSKVNKFIHSIVRQYGVDEQYNTLNMAVDGIYQKIVFLPETKKRYYGKLIYKNGKPCDMLDARGIEIRRCLTPDNLVITNEGVKTVRQVVKQQKRPLVYCGSNKFVPIKKIYKSKYSGKVYEITTEGNRKIKCTANHVFPTRALKTNWKSLYRRKQYTIPAFKQACDLKQGMFLLAPSKIEGSSYQNTISEEMASLLGMIISEGMVIKTYCNSSNCLSFTTHKREKRFQALFKEVAHKCFPDRKIHTFKADTKPNALTLKMLLTNNQFSLLSRYLRFKKNRGSLCTSSLLHRVPKEIFLSPPKHRSSFLRTYFEGEARVTGKSIVIGTPNGKLLKDVQQLLLSFGIGSSFSTTKKNLNWSRPNDVYEVSIPRRYFKEFQKKIGFISEEKNQKLTKFKYTKKYDKRLFRPIQNGHLILKIMSIKEYSVKDIIIYDFEVADPSHTFLVDFIYTHNSDWCQLAVNAQQHVLQLILSNSPKRAFTNFVKSLKRAVYKGTFDNQLVINKSLTKLPSEYSRKPLHVQVAEKDMNEGKEQYFLGDKIPYFVYGRVNGLLAAKHARQLGKTKPDYNYYLNHQLLPAIERVAQPVYGKKCTETYNIKDFTAGGL